MDYMRVSRGGRAWVVTKEGKSKYELHLTGKNKQKLSRYKLAGSAIYPVKLKSIKKGNQVMMDIVSAEVPLGFQTKKK